MTDASATGPAQNTSVVIRLQGDTVYLANHTYVPLSPHIESQRGIVESFSVDSARRLRQYLLACDADYRVFVTLTYPYGAQGSTSPELAKNHLRAFMERLRRLWGPVHARRESVCWWMEFTKAGLVHFHLLSTGWLDKAWVAQSWYSICGTEDVRHLRAGTRVEGLRSREASVRYAAKYATKQASDPIPDVGHIGRWWGIFGSRTTVEADLVIRNTSRVCGTVELGVVIDTFLVFLRHLEVMGKAQALWQECEEGCGWLYRIPRIEDRRAVRVFMMGLKCEFLCRYVDRGDELSWMGEEGVFP